MSVLSAVTSLLPPPAFLRMPALGVDISDTSLKYVFLEPDRFSGRSLSVQDWGSIDIPNGVLSRGTVQDVEALGKALSEVRSRTNIDMVRVSLPEERAYIFETNIDKSTPFKEIRGQLEFSLEENVPLSPREAYFDYEVIPDAVRSDMWRVIVTVYAKETIEHYYQACQMAGLTPLSFEVEAQAIARAAIVDSDPRTHMIVDFGKSRSGIGIVNNGSLMYTSTIDVGGDELSAALSKVLGDKEESAFTEVKNSLGIVPAHKQPEVREALLPVVDQVIEEIETRVQYWNTRMYEDENRQIHSAILCGGSANMRGLPSYLSEKLSMPVTRANVWTNIYDLQEQVPPIGRRLTYGYATAVGLALNSYI